MNKHYKIILENKLSELSKLANEIEDISKENHLSESIKFNINLCLDEIVTNIISYGYKDELRHQIEINIILNNNALEIEIIDDGIEFNPLKIPEPQLDIPLEERKIGGLGIHLVRSMIDKVEYKREENKNILKLIKFIK